MKGKIASSSLLAIALTLGGSAAMAQCIAQIQAEVQKALSNSKYESVHGSVESNGLVVLNGSVDVFDLREKIDHKVHRIKGVKAVENDIQIAGTPIPDQMIGSQRTTVSEVVGSLEERGAIENARGKIRIVDRTGLENMSCECYLVTRQLLARIYGLAKQPIFDE
jgi:osmotically-inducible protein OsmY